MDGKSIAANDWHGTVLPKLDMAKRLIDPTRPAARTVGRGAPEHSAVFGDEPGLEGITAYNGQFLRFVLAAIR